MSVTTSPTHSATVRRFFDHLWNRWELSVADEILTENLTFRGSLGNTLQGRAAFKGYVEMVRMAFPDWYNQIDELIVGDDGSTVVARMTYRGTHRGTLRGVPPTGRPVSYVGVAIFRFTGDLISEGWVVGDTQELWRAIGLLAEHTS